MTGIIGIAGISLSIRQTLKNPLANGCPTREPSMTVRVRLAILALIIFGNF